MEIPGDSTLNLQSIPLELASRRSRLAAIIIDALIVGLVTGILTFFTGGFDEMLEGMQPSLTQTLLLGLSGVIVFVLINGQLLARDGQTIGKRLLNIKIVAQDGLRADIPTLAKRYGFYWLLPQVPFLGPLLGLINYGFILGGSKRCLHDRFGGTKVVKAGSEVSSD